MILKKKCLHVVIFVFLIGQGLADLKLLRNYSMSKAVFSRKPENMFTRTINEFHRQLDVITQLEKENKKDELRLRIYKEYMLSRVYGSIFKDLYGRI